MIYELCVNAHNDALRISYALISGLCSFKIYLPEKDFESLKLEVEKLKDCTIADNAIKCDNGDLSFYVYCDKNSDHIYTKW
jgi:hypothetical protein